MQEDERRARFEELAPALVEPLRRYLARRTDPATADDVLAETLLVCWRRLDELADDPLPWAYGVCRHCLANAERSARRQRRVAGKVAALDPPRATTPGPEHTAGDPVLTTALSGLAAGDAEVLRLWAWEDLGASGIAAVLGVSPNAASIRLHRAKDRLAAALRKIDGPAGHEGAEGRTR